MIKEITCIQCPIGCTMAIEYEGKTIQNISGHKCIKGKHYAEEEFFHSKRVLTSTVLCKTKIGYIPLSVKTDGGIPLDLLKTAVLELRKKEYPAPIRIKDILYENILGTGVNVIATQSAD